MTVLAPATADDAGAMARILGDWVRETGWMPVLHSRDEDRGFCAQLVASGPVTVARAAGAEGNGVLGFLALSGDTVAALHLAPAARGQGLGRRLLDAARAGRDRLDLWTFQANAGALRFYAREGFVAVERTDGRDNDERLPDVRLVWERQAQG